MYSSIMIITSVTRQIIIALCVYAQFQLNGLGMYKGS